MKVHLLYFCFAVFIVAKDTYSKEDYWPDLSCVPGWKSTSGDEHITALEQIVAGCEASGCVKMCILRGVGVLEENGSLAPHSKSTYSLAKYLKDEGEMDKFMTSGGILARIKFLVEAQNLKLNEDTLNCKGDAQKLVDIVDQIMTLSCKQFPPLMEWFNIPLEKLDLSTYFPKFKCGFGGMQVLNESTTLEELSPGMRTLLTINRNCHAEFDQFEYILNRTGVQGTENCAHVCTMERIHLIFPTSGTYVNREYDFDIPERPEKFFLKEFNLEGEKIPDFGYWLHLFAWTGDRWWYGLKPCWDWKEWVDTKSQINSMFEHVCWKLEDDESHNWTSYQKTFRDNPFPDFSCLPGWQDYNENMNPLITDGLRTEEQSKILVKFGPRRHGYDNDAVDCAPVVTRYGDIARNPLRTMQYCILRRFSIIKDFGDGSETKRLGTVDEIAEYLVDFYIEEEKLNGFSKKFVGKWAASYLLNALNTTQEFSVDDIISRPWDDVKWSPFHDFIDSTLRTLCQSTSHPPSFYRFPGNATITTSNLRKEENLSEIFWPKMTCIRGWYNDASKGNHDAFSDEFNQGAKLLYRMNRNCKENFREDIYWSFENHTFPSEVCSKICVLQELGVIRPGEEPKLENLTYTFSTDDKKKVGELFSKLLSDDGEDAREGKELGERLHDFVGKLFGEMKLGDTPCHKKDVWLPLLNEVDEFFVAECTANPIGSHWLGVEHTSYANGAKGEKLIHLDSIRKSMGLNLSCYPSDGKGMTKLAAVGMECEGILKKFGVTTDCQTSCCLHKMGLFTWGEEGNGEIRLQLQKVEKIGTQLKDYFSNTEVAEKIAARIEEKCLRIWNKVAGSSCRKPSKFEDCVERVLSCQYTQQFLKNGDSIVTENINDLNVPSLKLLTGNKSEECRRSGNIVELKPMDFSCRPSFFGESKNLSSLDYRFGVGRIRKIRIECLTLVKYGYNSCEDQCILEELGIIVIHSGNKSSDNTFLKTYKINTNEKITGKLLRRMFTGGGGEEMSRTIAETVTDKCSKFVSPEKGLGKECGTTEWRDFSRCVHSVMDCTPVYFHRNFE